MGAGSRAPRPTALPSGMSDAHLFRGGHIFTGTGYAEAVLVERDEFVAVGSNDEIERNRPKGAEIHDLRGDLVVPGLIDAHLHLAEMAVQESGIELTGAASLPELIERTRRWSSAHPNGPIVGRGWNIPNAGENDWPTRDDLDAVDGGRAVILYHASGHAAVANSAAMQQLGIDRTTPDPVGGRIGRDREGEPNGRLLETALGPTTKLAHEVALADPASLVRQFRRLASLGITAVGTMNSDPAELSALTTALIGPGLPVRVACYLNLEWFDHLSDSAVAGLVAPTERLRVAGVKAFMDGAFGTRTAWLAEPYSDDPSTSGMPVHPRDFLVPVFARAHRIGLTPAVHALGDRAVAEALRTLQQARPNPDRPIGRIEHAGLVPPDLGREIAPSGAALVVQPIFIASDHWLAQRLGPARARWAYPFASLLAAGCRLAGSSDAPFDALDPWQGMRVAVRRTDTGGRSANPAPTEAVAPEVALRMYTIEGARAIGFRALGTIAPGRPADFVRCAAPSLERAAEVGGSGVRETWVGGVRVHPK